MLRRYAWIVVCLVCITIILLALLSTVDIQACLLFGRSLSLDHVFVWPELAPHRFTEHTLIVSGTHQRTRLHGVLFHSGSRQNKRGLVFCCRGIWQNVQHVGKRASLFLDQGWDVWMWDYRGSGKSRGEGVLRETIIYDDALLVFERVARAYHTRKQPIIAWGICIGGATASYVAAHASIPCSALVLESTPPSALSLTTMWWWFRWINPWVHFTFDTCRHMRHLRHPTTVWIIEGLRDPLLCRNSAAQLAAHLPHPHIMHHLVIESGHHTNLHYCDEYKLAITRISNATNL
jgi:pimeloyl-ACP methyl ester carboxylesterase